MGMYVNPGNQSLKETVNWILRGRICVSAGRAALENPWMRICLLPITARDAIQRRYLIYDEKSSNVFIPNQEIAQAFWQDTGHEHVHVGGKTAVI